MADPDPVIIERDDLKVIIAAALRIIEVAREAMPEANTGRAGKVLRDVSIEAQAIIQLAKPHLTVIRMVPRGGI